MAYKEEPVARLSTLRLRRHIPSKVKKMFARGFGTLNGAARDGRHQTMPVLPRRHLTWAQTSGRMGPRQCFCRARQASLRVCPEPV